MWARRTGELLGMLMIGEGVLAVIAPRRHVLLWREGPEAWNRLMDPFLRHPTVTRWLGAAEIAAGVWLARRQYRELPSNGVEPEESPCWAPMPAQGSVWEVGAR